MATTLSIPSFAQNNIKERTSLTLDYVSGTALTVESTQGFASSDTLYVGALSREGCEKVTVSAVPNATTLTLSSALQTPHSRLDAVTSVLGDRIRIYRAVNVDGSIPADGLFTVIATRSIDPDQLSTYYTDSSGGSNYWYRYTYFNETTLEETSLLDSEPRRGDDYGRYCSVSEIRTEAGFENAHNLKDGTIDQQRRAAEAEINSTLRSAYTTPFTKPIPQKIKYLTIKLAAGFLLQAVYHGQSAQGDTLVKDVRAQLKLLQNKGDVLDDDAQTPYTGTHVNSWPNDSTSSEEGGGPVFSMADRL